MYHAKSMTGVQNLEQSTWFFYLSTLTFILTGLDLWQGFLNFGLDFYIHAFFVRVFLFFQFYNKWLKKRVKNKLIDF